MCYAEGGELVFNKGLKQNEYEKLYNILYHSLIEQTVIGVAQCDLKSKKN